MELVPILLFWALVVWALWINPKAALYLFFGSMSFGAFAVIPPALTGGLTLTSTPVIGSLFAIKMLLEKGGRSLGSIALSKSGPVYLVAYWLVALMVTVLMPRLFEGAVLIIPVRLTESTSGELLYPTTQNFSQITYLSLSILAVFAFHRHTLKHFRFNTFFPSIQFGAACVIATGVLDYASQTINLGWLLEPLRTASYGLITSDMVLNSKRVVGLMPEASAYGTLCLFFLAVLYFCQSPFQRSTQARIKNMALIFSLIGMIVLSTSSSAYVGLAVFFLLTLFDWFHHDIFRKRKIVGRNFLFLSFAALCIVVSGFLFPDIANHTIELVNEMVFNKKESASYEERTMWTVTSMEALMSTYGLGVGVGSTRTSNFLAAIFSNTGILGGLLFCLFVLSTFIKYPASEAPEYKSLRRGISLAFLAYVSSLILAGPTPDFGMANAYLFGLAGGLAMKSTHARQTTRSPTQAGKHGTRQYQF